MMDFCGAGFPEKGKNTIFVNDSASQSYSATPENSVKS